VQCRCSWDNGKARCGQKVAGWEMATRKSSGAGQSRKQVGANVDILGIMVRRDAVKK